MNTEDTMTRTTKTLTGHDAIEYAEAHGLPLCSYDSPVDDSRDDLTPDEAREIAAEDPSLVYVEVMANAWPPAPFSVRVPESITAGPNGVVITHLAAGTYLVRAPADYDPAQVTGMDLCCDPELTIVGFRPGRAK